MFEPYKVQEVLVDRDPLPLECITEVLRWNGPLAFSEIFLQVKQNNRALAVLNC